MASINTTSNQGHRYLTSACHCAITMLSLVPVCPSHADGSRELILNLSGETNRETKALLIGQLQFVAHDDAVPVLAAYLADERLCDPAARVLVTIGTRPAAQALLQSLRTSHAGRVVTVVQALGDLAYSPAVPDVQRFATDHDAGLRHVAWYTLARCGDRSLIPVLIRYRATDRDAATTELFRLARRLKDPAICRAVLLTQPTPAEQSGALETLAEVDAAGVLPDAKAALENSSTPVRMTAIHILTGLGSTRAWIPFWSRSSQARTALRGALKNPDPAVRAAAFAALAEFADKTAPAANASALSDPDP